MMTEHPQLEGHEWVRHLGGGGSAHVHLYRQEAPPRDVAVKVLRRGSDATVREALGREAAALSAVAGHPAVVQLYSVGEAADGRPWLAMEYCPGHDLGARAREERLPVRDVLETMIAVAGGAEAMHQAGYVHRDIKPANIFHTRWGKPVLGDFGAALPNGAEAEDAGFSPAWSPPEQHVGAAAHPTQDVWALAASCWTLLAGRSPFEIPGGDNGDAALLARIRNGAFSGLGRADCPAALEDVLRRALALSPTQRTPTAEAFASQLRALEAELGSAESDFAPGPIRPVSTSTLGAADDDDSTRPASVRVIDPTGLPAGDETIIGSPTTSAAGQRPAPPRAKTPPKSRATERTGPKPWVLLLAGLLVILTSVAITIGVLTGQGVRPAPTTTTDPADPLDPVAAPPDPIGDAEGELRGDKIVWTWRPSEEEGVRYQVTTTTPGSEPAHQRTTFTTLEVAAASGENCFSVVAVAKDGRPSAPLDRCIDIP